MNPLGWGHCCSSPQDSGEGIESSDLLYKTSTCQDSGGISSMFKHEEGLETKPLHETTIFRH